MINLRNIAFMLMLIGSFQASSQTPVKKIYIDDHLIPCKLPGQAKCMLIKEDPKDNWKPFYGQIQDFHYEEGNHYELLVEIHTKKETPDDTTTYHYALQKILVQTKHEIEDIFELDDAPWFLKKLDGTTKIPHPEKFKAFVIFHVDENKLSGNTGCNKFSGPIETKDNIITIGKLKLTDLSCSNEAKLLQTEFLRQLALVNKFIIKSGKLYLYHDKDLLMVLIKK
ncbi:MAG: DUF4377 domain-containing protein [Bacteroidia bacterium]